MSAFHPLIANNDFGPLFFLLAFYGVLAAAFLAVSLLVSAVVCFLITNNLAQLPPQYRRIQPGMVWLLMIPCFGIIWNFFVFPKVSESFQAFFAAHGRRDLGDCGQAIGLAYCICVATALIPILNYMTGFAAIVLLVLVLVRFHDLRQQVQLMLSPGPAPVPPPVV